MQVDKTVQYPKRVTSNDSSVGISTVYGLGGRGSILGRDKWLFSIP
jgi:hypothetical protein